MALPWPNEEDMHLLVPAKVGSRHLIHRVVLEDVVRLVLRLVAP